MEAVKLIKSEVVVPCHYNNLGLFSNSYNPVDVVWFKKEVEEAGFECTVLSLGESVSFPGGEKRKEQQIALQSN